MITNLKDAETAWAADSVVVLPGDAQQVNNALSTLSDGENTFASSNASVATVDAEGNISLVGTGHTVISVTTAETATYLESRASFDLFVIEGTGEVDKAFTAADVQYYNGRPLPHDAPPRPSDTAEWDEASQSWLELYR